MLGEIDLHEIDKIANKYQGDRGALIQVLLDVQNACNWLPQAALRRVGERLGVAFSEVYRVASFYKALSLSPRGRHQVRVCLGTACHVRGAPRILERVEQVLNIKAGDTTQDMRFTLERVNCLGCCALGPVMVVDDKAHGKLALAKVEEVLNQYD